MSPLSVEIVMALAQTGARGRTLNQLATALRLPTKVKDVEDLMKNVLPTLSGNHNYTLSSANKIYVQKDAKIASDFE